MLASTEDSASICRQTYSIDHRYRLRRGAHQCGREDTLYSLHVGSESDIHRITGYYKTHCDQKRSHSASLRVSDEYAEPARTHS